MSIVDETITQCASCNKLAENSLFLTNVIESKQFLIKNLHVSSEKVSVKNSQEIVPPSVSTENDSLSTSRSMYAQG